MAENAKPAGSEESEEQSVLGLQDLESAAEETDVEAHNSSLSFAVCATAAD